MSQDSSHISRIKQPSTFELIRKLGNQIKERRLRKKWTQEDLSRESGIERAWISRIENSTDTNPTVGTLASIASALDMTIELSPIR